MQGFGQCSFKDGVPGFVQEKEFMKCSECGVELTSQLPMCSDCIARRKRHRQNLQQQYNRSSGGGVTGDFVGLIRDNFSMLLLAGAGLLIALSFAGVFGYGNLPEVRLAAARGSGSDPCTYAEKCMIAYLAPWCPSCQSAVGFMNGVHRELRKGDKTALKVVLGMAEENSLQKMAGQFEAPVFLDLSGEFASKVGIRAVPSVLVVDAQGKITEKGLPGAIRGTGSLEGDVQYYIRNILNFE